RRVPLPVAVRRLPRPRVRGDGKLSRRGTVLFVSTRIGYPSTSVRSAGGTIMTHRSFIRSATLVAWIAASTALLAQSGSVAYNPREETTISGTILHVVSVQAPDGFGV